jgi:glycosyltransferase involved in cell wall biosynthesis
VWALVSPVYRDEILTEVQRRSELRKIHWLFPEPWYWPVRAGKSSSWGRLFYVAWQRAALTAARRLVDEVAFDAVHHLTWGGIRYPTFLGALGLPFIFGPVGGGETSPPLLRRSFSAKERMVETVRDLSNATLGYSPLVRSSLLRSTIIVATTSETRDLLDDSFRGKTIVYCPQTVENTEIGQPKSDHHHPLRLLFMGRLLHWKGVYLALDAFAKFRALVPGARLTIIGRGHGEENVRARLRSLGLADCVAFITEYMPQARLFEYYDSHDVLLFPSMRDSSGTVALEALCRGMPVICLDTGGPKEMVTASCGVVVPTYRQDSAQLAQYMADTLAYLNAHPALFAALSRGAIARAKEFVLSDRVVHFYQIVEDAIFVHPSSHEAKSPA